MGGGRGRRVSVAEAAGYSEEFHRSLRTVNIKRQQQALIGSGRETKTENGRGSRGGGDGKLTLNLNNINTTVYRSIIDYLMRCVKKTVLVHRADL